MTKSPLNTIDTKQLQNSIQYYKIILISLNIFGPTSLFYFCKINEKNLHRVHIKEKYDRIISKQYQTLMVIVGFNRKIMNLKL